MKYLFLTDGASYFPQLLTDNIERAGLYNWPQAMEGEVRLWSDLKHRPHELLDYDVIHINLASSDIGLADKIHKHVANSSTKIVVNMDYSINYMDTHTNLRDFVNDLIACDAAFGVEPAQVNLMYYMTHIIKRDKPLRLSLIPHPVNLQRMETEHWIPYNERLPILCYQYHKYDGHWEIPRLLMLDLDVLTACVGYYGESFKTADMPELVMPYVEFSKFLMFLSRCKYGFEYRTHKAASRFIMEAGSLGIPCVSTADSYMGTMIYPELSYAVEDFKGIRDGIIKLIDNEEWGLQLADIGLRRLEQFDYAHSKQAMERLINADL